jgi:hypothetical protein
VLDATTGRTLVRSVRRAGFETAIPLDARASYRVQALDARGRVLGTSPAFAARR